MKARRVIGYALTKQLPSRALAKGTKFAANKMKKVVVRVKKNLQQADKDWRAGKIKKYGTINPFK